MPSTALDLGRLTPWLVENVPQFDGSVPPQTHLLAGGRSNLTYALTDASGRRFALRRPPLGHVMPKAHDMAREYRVLRGLQHADYPSPPALALCGDLDVMGVPFLVMGFVDGHVLTDRADTERLTPKQADMVSLRLVEGLANLHQVDVASAGLSDLGRPDSYLERQVGLWARQWSTTKTRDLEVVEALGRWLQCQIRNMREHPAGVLVHGDYRLDNVIWTDDMTRLRAVLDWEMSTRGDPVADLAVALVYWTEPGDRLRALVPVAQGATSPSGFWSRARVVHTYEALTGFDVSHLRFCVSLACYKLAVIMESIHFRTMAGQQRGTAADGGEDMGAAPEALAQLGLNVAESGPLEGLSS